MKERLRNWARSLKQQLLVLWFCTRHPATPWYAKAVAAAVVLYAFSPIDLIPDFIPVLGYLDDVILVPLGIWIVLHMLPSSVQQDCRKQADEWLSSRQPKPRSVAGAAIVIAAWMLLLWLGWEWARTWGAW